MKRIGSLAVAAATLFLFCWGVPAEAQYSGKVYREQGGDKLVVASGGEIEVQSGGVLDLQSGAVLTTSVVSLAAAGNSQGTAAALAGDVTIVTGADNTKAVVLPTAVVGAKYIVVNSVANKTLPVYPATGAAINGGGADNAFTMGPGKVAGFYCTALLTWYTDGQAAATPNTTELALLTGAGTGGTVVAGKAQVGDANQNLGAIKGTSLAIGTSGSETSLTATVAQLNSLAGSIGGLSAIVAAGLGGSHSIIKTETGTHTVIAAHASKDRAVLACATVDEAIATGDTSRTLISFGETDTTTKLWGNANFPDGMAAGTVICGAFTNTATKDIVITTTAAAGTGTGGVTIVALALPTT